MTNLIKYLTDNIGTSQKENATLVCNYSDNYYGDQICRIVENR